MYQVYPCNSNSLNYMPQFIGASLCLIWMGESEQVKYAVSSQEIHSETLLSFWCCVQSYKTTCIV